MLTLVLLADFLWMCLPGWLLILVAWLLDIGSDGALGPGFGALLVFGLAIVTTVLWGPYSFKISKPLMKKALIRYGIKPPPEED